MNLHSKTNSTAFQFLYTYCSYSLLFMDFTAALKINSLKSYNALIVWQLASQLDPWNIIHKMRDKLKPQKFPVNYNMCVCMFVCACVCVCMCVCVCVLPKPTTYAHHGKEQFSLSMDSSINTPTSQLITSTPLPMLMDLLF